ncbi:MAG: mannitol dehydrogenase family protein [Pseudomonadota bacterium]|nr:mannitol dehydrogenase family protein [Pseudomonadota bacterium]
MSDPRPRLTSSTLDRLHKNVGAPGYDRRKVASGVAHFGPGVFFRAHVAWHFDRLLSVDPRWGVSAISLRSGGLAQALGEQDCLYTLAELAEPARFQIIGALTEYVSGADDPARALDRLVDPSTKLVTLTVTEKGYCLDAGGALDWKHDDVRRDLAGGGLLYSVVGWLTESLWRRREAGHAPFTVLSCDNLSDNGPKLRRAVIQFASERRGPFFAQWIENEVRFPATMVDSITPATDEALKRRVAEATGLADEAPVQRESFTQWVIEDSLGPDAPDLARAGAILTGDVALYEQAKLRLLNGAHSALAYIGLLAGQETTRDAMAHRIIGPFVERLMRNDSAATLRAGGGLDAQAYVSALVERFLNPAVRHTLSKIASDGSQKLPYRILNPVRDLLRAGLSVDRPATVAAAWMRYAVGRQRAGEKLDDPLALQLEKIAAACTDDAAGDTDRFLSLRSVFEADLAENPRFVAAVRAAYGRLVGDPLNLEA